jgi:hypothetical protein
MSPSTLSSALLAVAAITFVHAQPDPADPTPLVDKHYAYPSEIVSPLRGGAQQHVLIVASLTKSTIILLLFAVPKLVTIFATPQLKPRALCVKHRL